MDLNLIPWDILDQMEVFFQYLDQHIIDDIEFWDFNAYAVPYQAIYDLPDGILDFLDDLLLAADAQAHRLQGTAGYYA